MRGALKTFGYPEFFVPAHRLRRALPEHTLILPSDFPDLLAAATEFLTRIVDRYRTHPGIVAWQVEHEAVDPLGVEHSWRLAAAFVEQEVDAVRRCDPSRPILMNGFLPASLPVRLTQWWQTRDQGDSLPSPSGSPISSGSTTTRGMRCSALATGRSTWMVLEVPGASRAAVNLLAWSRTPGRRLMISEGQAEPWEAVTTPPNPRNQWMYSCTPDQLIATYNQCLMWASEASVSLEAYLFWGAEYWIVRQHAGDPTYVRAFARILENA